MVSRFMGNFRKERLTVRENLCPRFLLVKCVTECYGVEEPSGFEEEPE